MQPLEVTGVRLDGVVACVPRAAVANPPDLASATGIRELRRAAAGVTPLDLCCAAAERLLAGVEEGRGEIGAVVFVSFTSPARMPAASATAQARLGLARTALALDLSLACSGWPYGLYVAALLSRNLGKSVLLLDGDVQSARLDPADRSTQAVLSDAGSAALVSPCAGARPWRFAFLTDGEKGKALGLADGGTIAMDGFGVFRFVATDVAEFLRAFVAGLPPGFAFVPHQANVYMVSQLAKALGIEAGRTAVVCDEFGNAASASVPCAIAGRGVRGPVVATGFGGGLSASAVYLEIDDAARLECVGYDSACCLGHPDAE